jgi:hypothetical protein
MHNPIVSHGIGLVPVLAVVLCGVPACNGGSSFPAGDVAVDAPDLAVGSPDSVDAAELVRSLDQCGDADLGGVDTKEVVEARWEEEENDDCHYDCFGGVRCVNGTMEAAHWGAIPCWVEDYDDCFLHGMSWPCLSGVCGLFELCQDDIETLVALLPADVEWIAAEMEIDEEDGGGWGFVKCDEHPCEGRFRDGQGESLLAFSVQALASVPGTWLEETTHLVATSFDAETWTGSGMPGVEVAGVAVEAEKVTFLWPKYMRGLGRDEPLHPTHGLSGAVVLEREDGSTLTAVWLVQSNYRSNFQKVKLGLFESPPPDER